MLQIYLHNIYIPGYGDYCHIIIQLQLLYYIKFYNKYIILSIRNLEKYYIRNTLYKYNSILE